MVVVEVKITLEKSALVVLLAELDPMVKLYGLVWLHSPMDMSYLPAGKVARFVVVVVCAFSV